MNKVNGVKIREITYCVPETERDNQYYFDLFGEKSFAIEPIIEDALGKFKRFVVNPEKGENATALAIEASKKVLEKAGLTSQDIDMICFASFTPEHVAPIGSIEIHNAIKGRPDAFCYDINANCVGMVFAFDQLSKYMTASTSVKRALLVGGECMSLAFAPDDMTSQMCYGDSACALIVEKTEDESYLVDTRFLVESDLAFAASSPKCGLSKAFTAPVEQRYYSFNPPEPNVDNPVGIVKQMLADNGLSVEDIKLFCTTQFAKYVADEFYEKLGVKEEQQIYVGDRFGYTGANSPFLSLHEAIQQGKVERGDLVLMWTIGVGTQHIMTLMRY